MSPDVSGPEGMRQVVSGFYAAFPDMVIYLEEVIGEGDTVATRGILRRNQQWQLHGCACIWQKSQGSLYGFLETERC